jgi:hypothetical protein
MHCDSFSPRRTGLADLPHPALAGHSPKAFAAGCLQRLGLSVKYHSQMNKVTEVSDVHYGTFVQVDYSSFRLKHSPANAPSLPGHYPASTLLWASPTPDQDHAGGYAFPPAVAGHPPSCRVSQVPRLFCRHALSPATPESPAAAYACCFAADDRLQRSRRISHSQ